VTKQEEKSKDKSAKTEWIWRVKLDTAPCSVLCLVSQSYLTLCNPMDCSPPGSSSMGILQARMLERVAMPSSRGSSQPRDWIQVSCIAGRFFTIWATGVQLYWYSFQEHYYFCFVRCLYILEIKLSLVALFANIFYRSFHFVYGFLFCVKAYRFDWVPFVYFCFYFYCFGRLT